MVSPGNVVQDACKYFHISLGFNGFQILHSVTFILRVVHSSGADIDEREKKYPMFE